MKEENMHATFQMKFSLIVATKDRDVELKNFLDALRSHTYLDFEIIIVDQNKDDRINRVIENFPEFRIIYLKSEPGISRARNLGLMKASGDILAFPDDDCWYSNDLLSRINQFFSLNPLIAGVTGRTMSGKNKKAIWKWDKKEGYIDKYNIWQRANSNSIFINRKMIDKNLAFDEKLGVGAGTPWGSGEEIDFLLQILRTGQKIKYDPSIIVYHEDSFPINDEKAIQKNFSYSSGMGFVLRKYQYPPLFVSKYLVKPFLNTFRALVNRDPYRARFMWAMLCGRIKGLRGYRE